MGRDIDEEEKVAPPVVRKVDPPATQLQREQVAPLVMRQVSPPIVSYSEGARVHRESIPQYPRGRKSSQDSS
jgi:hypothetical protein